MNLNREAAQAAEADPAVAASDAADPAADVRAVADMEAAKVVAVVAMEVEAGDHEAMINDAGRHAVARMANRQGSSSAHDSNIAKMKSANRRCRRFRSARQLDKSRLRR